jgi:hypothetical protein
MYKRTKNVDENNKNFVFITLKMREVTNKINKRVKRGTTVQGR